MTSPAPGYLVRLGRRLGLRRAGAPPRRDTPAGGTGGPRLLYVGPDAAALAGLAERLEETLPDLDVVGALTMAAAGIGTAPSPGDRAPEAQTGTLAPASLAPGPLAPGPHAPEADGPGADATAPDPPGADPAGGSAVGPPRLARPARRPAAPRIVAPPAERGRRDAARWLQELRPDLVLFHGALSEDPLLAAIAESGRRAVAVDVPAPPAHDRRAARSALAAMHRTLARDAEAGRVLREIGPPGARIEIAGPFVALPDPPPCDATERDHIAHVLEARPVWLAVDPAPPEIAALLEAHRTALQGAHRLLLVLVPASDEEGPGLARFLREQGWRVTRRGAEGEPDDATEIFVADSRDELGLWYRIAPLTCLGGTFAGGAVPDAAAPASLGSAIVAGPKGGDRAAFLDRLESAGGLYRVAQAGGLGAAVATLLAPDRAAALAHAAWDVASDGARVRERVVAALRDALRATAG